MERPHNFNKAPFVGDKIVFKKYIESIKSISGWFPFKQKVVNLPNSYQYALNRMLKLEQHFKKYNELKGNYLKHMGKPF